MRAILATTMVAMTATAAHADVSEGPIAGAGGDVIAIVIAIVVALGVIGGGLWLAWRKRTA